MYVVVGLGNPGRRYAATRHNVGFMIIERLAERWHIQLADGGSVRMGRGRFDDQPVLLVQPQRYMNLSGEALLEALPELAPLENPARDVIVVHDDMDLVCGQLRVKRGGGSGGHRGVTSIAQRCGADFLRVRVGVGRPAAGEDAAAHVLADFADAERETMTGTIERAADAVESLVTVGLETTMNRFNQRVPAAARAS